MWLIPNFGTVLPESLGYLPVVSTILGYEHHVILGKKDSKNIPSVSPEAHLALVHGMLRFVEGYGVFLAQFARKPGLVDTLISPLPGFFQKFTESYGHRPNDGANIVIFGAHHHETGQC